MSRSICGRGAGVGD
uniref:Uncharacterized protein n=1 Tax=Anguilla anguilla TaxID=7936 RepID=A0A0E9W445_ANGAN